MAWNDEQGQVLFERYATVANDMLEDQAAGLGHDAAIERYKAGDIAFAPTGNWQAGALEPAAGSDIAPAEFEWKLGAKLPGYARLEWHFDAIEAVYGAGYRWLPQH